MQRYVKFWKYVQKKRATLQLLSSLFGCSRYSESGVTLTYDLPPDFLQNDTVPCTNAKRV